MMVKEMKIGFTLLAALAVGACGEGPRYGYVYGAYYAPRHVPIEKQKCAPDTFDVNGVRTSHCVGTRVGQNRAKGGDYPAFFLFHPYF